MRDRAPFTPNLTSEQFAPFSGCLARLFWMAAGNILLLFLAAGIFLKSPNAFSWLDFGYGAVVVGALAVRYVDIQYLGGRAADGSPVTFRDWVGYAAGLCSAAAILWAAAHSFG